MTTPTEMARRAAKGAAARTTLRILFVFAAFGYVELAVAAAHWAVLVTLPPSAASDVMGEGAFAPPLVSTFGTAFRAAYTSVGLAGVLGRAALVLAALRGHLRPSPGWLLGLGLGGLVAHAAAMGARVAQTAVAARVHGAEGLAELNIVAAYASGMAALGWWVAFGLLLILAFREATRRPRAGAEDGPYRAASL